MLTPVIIGSILSIVTEGFKFFNEKQRTRFIDEHYDILKLLNVAKNKSLKNYSDSEKDKLLLKLSIFLKAYYSELKMVPA